jgi:aminomethyltransferase
MVVNGATKAGDMAHFDAILASEFKGKDVSYEYLATQNLVALQGPASIDVLCSLAEPSARDSLRAMSFMTGAQLVRIAGVECSVVRCGYTGEDGFEVGMPAEAATTVASAFLGDARVQPAALGPRDSLRLEAGLCLYGHDIDATTSPNEAALTWVIGKARREPDRANFIGAGPILAELQAKSWTRRRVGLNIIGAPAREGAVIYTRSKDGSTNPSSATKIGVLTSGTFSPCLKAPIGMGYVATAHSKIGSEVAIDVRGKLVNALVTGMPFVPTKYFKA